MNPILQQLLSVAPGIGAAIGGDGHATQAFMEGYQRTLAQIEQQKRLKQQDQFAQQDRQTAADDRQRLITRQTEADQRAGEIGKQQDYNRSLDAVGQITQSASNFDDPAQAKSFIESMMPNLMSVYGQGAMALGQPAVEQAQQVITGRQKKQVEDFLGKWEKSETAAQVKDTDPLLTSLPDHIAKMIGKPEARLSELQKFAQLPVGLPAKAKEKPAAFTLSPGATRYDGEGKPIATAPERQKPAGDGLPDQIFVVRDGKVVPILKGTARPGDLPYSQRNEQPGRPLTVTSVNDLAGIDEALKLANGLDFKPEDTGIMPSIGGAMPDAVTNATGFGVGAKQRQGVISLVKQIIGKGLEGGVLRKEDESKYAKILPTLSDHPDVVTTKIANLKRIMQQKRDTLLQTLEDAGYDVGKSKARGETPAPQTAAPSADGRKAAVKGERRKFGSDLREWNGSRWELVKP